MHTREYKNCWICGERFDIDEGHTCQPKNTKQRLAVELAKSEAPRWMIERARDGYYDDYDSHLPTPIRQLVHDASSENLYEIAAKAMNGDYDATKEESKAWWEREGKQLFNN